MRKFAFIMAVVLPLMVFTGCSDDDDDDLLTVTKENIVGNWNITANDLYPAASGYIAIDNEKISLIYYFNGDDKSPAIQTFAYSIKDGKISLTSDDITPPTVDVENLTKDEFSIALNYEAATATIACSRIKATSTDVTKSEILGTWTIDGEIEGASNLELTFNSNNRYTLPRNGYNEIGHYAVCGSTIHMAGDVYKMVVKSKGDKTMNLDMYVEGSGKTEVTAKKK